MLASFVVMVMILAWGAFGVLTALALLRLLARSEEPDE
jgi:hypothetical protein